MTKGFALNHDQSSEDLLVQSKVPCKKQLSEIF